MVVWPKIGLGLRLAGGREWKVDFRMDLTGLYVRCISNDRHNIICVLEVLMAAISDLVSVAKFWIALIRRRIITNLTLHSKITRIQKNLVALLSVAISNVV